MPDSVHFGGLRHYPIGNASLLKNSNQLIVSELTNPMDGIAIETGHATNVAIGLVPLALTTNAVLAITFHTTDRLQRLKNIAQWVVMPEAGRNTASLMLNSNLEGGSIELTGKLGKMDLFHKRISAAAAPGDQWLLIGSFDLTHGHTWLSGIHCRMDVVRDKNGRIIKVTTTKTIGGSAMIQPLKNNLPVTGAALKNSYPIDTIRIVSEVLYPEGLPYERESHISSVMITGQDLPAVVLTHSKAQ